jgi:anti-sigma factor RsiW
MISKLTCRRVVAALMDYVDGTLAASTRGGVEDHLQTCAPCRDFARAYRATPGVVRRATGPRRAEASLRQLCARALKRRPLRS